MLEKTPVLVGAIGEGGRQTDTWLHPAPDDHSRLLHVPFGIEAGLGTSSLGTSKDLNAFQLCITSDCSVDNRCGEIKARQRREDGPDPHCCYLGIKWKSGRPTCTQEAGTFEKL